MKKSHQKKFVSGDVEGLFGSLEDSLYQLVQGPEVKNQATFDYEYIMKMLLLKKEVTFSVENGTYFVEIENKKFNYSEILANFNAGHLTIDERYHTLYIDYLKNNSEQKPKKDPNFASRGQSNWATEAYFNKRDKNKELEDLSYAEKCAINIYTQDYYKTMNGILRGDIVIPPEKSTFQNDMMEVMLHNGFSASGLNKVDNTQVSHAFRVDKAPPKELTEKKVASIEGETEVFSERGFISSSKDKPTFKAKSGAVCTVFANIIGKHIGPLSFYSKEREVLIPPNTQIKYTKSKEEKGVTYLYGDAVRTPKLNQMPTDRRELTAQELLLEEKLEVELLIKNVQNLKRDYSKKKWKLHADVERKHQIEKLLTKANQLADNPNMPPREKMVKITEALLTVKNEIQAKQAKKSAFFLPFQSKSRLVESIDDNLKLLSQKTKDNYDAYEDKPPENNNPLYNAKKEDLSIYADNFLYDERMKPIIEHVHGKLSQPYRDKATKNVGEHNFVYNKKVVNRPNHGTTHSLRGALMVPMVLGYYKKNGKDMKGFDKLGIDDMKRMEIAMLFASVGRECEDNEKYKEYRDNSVIAFKEYCQKNCKDIFNEKQLEEYIGYLKNYTDPLESRKSPKAEIMRMCHSLDVLRYADDMKFKLYCKDELVTRLGERAAGELIDYSRNCLAATGNRITVGERKEYNAKVFTMCSLNPQKTLEEFKKVALPKDLIKRQEITRPKFKAS